MIRLEQFRSLIERHETPTGLAREARRLTRQYFGRDVALYTPLYLDNHCDGSCLYCGFNRRRSLARIKLDSAQIEAELSVISGWGIDHILLLSGDSPKSSTLAYLLSAVALARRYFSAVTLEVYPLEEEAYRKLVAAGADGIALYQETYDRSLYRRMHPDGRKSDFDYRFEATRRMAQAGVRRMALGVLLGLGDPAADLHALFCHLESMQREFPGIEYQLAFPRLVPVVGDEPPCAPLADIQLLTAIGLARLLFPRIGISLSTRETAELRDAALDIGVTRISAGSRTGVGGYAANTETAPQFAVRDRRSVSEIVAWLQRRGFNPIFTDWLALERNEPEEFKGA